MLQGRLPAATWEGKDRLSQISLSIVPFLLALAATGGRHERPPEPSPAKRLLDALVMDRDDPLLPRRLAWALSLGRVWAHGKNSYSGCASTDHWRKPKPTARDWKSSLLAILHSKF